MLALRQGECQRAARRVATVPPLITATRQECLELHGPFILARLGSDAELAHLDNQLRGQTVDSPNDVAALGQRWETVTGEALPRRQSVRLIEEVAKTWT